MNIQEVKEEDFKTKLFIVHEKLHIIQHFTETCNFGSKHYRQIIKDAIKALELALEEYEAKYED